MFGDTQVLFEQRFRGSFATIIYYENMNTEMLMCLLEYKRVAYSPIVHSDSSGLCGCVWILYKLYDIQTSFDEQTSCKIISRFSERSL